MLSLVLLAGLLSGAAGYTKEALLDQVKNLPGAEALNLNFKQFSGYLDIPGTSGSLSKHLHYWCVRLIYVSSMKAN